MASMNAERVTPEELLLMPDGERYELVDGELVERNMGGKDVWVATRIAARLVQYGEAHGGWAFGDSLGYRCFGEDTDRVRVPDASFIVRGRFPDNELPEGFVTIPPDLAVEVVSPSDNYYEVETKVAEYLDAGVRMVWVVNPQQRHVRVVTSDGEQLRRLTGDDELSGGDVLPGLSFKIAELFAAV